MSEHAFNSQSRTIGDLLLSNQPARIVVPTFQRGYSWEKKHVSAFWADISDPARPRKFFLGPIVILNKSETIIELLDGQQRLATATILFSVLRDLAGLLKMKAADDFAAYVQRDFIIGEDGFRRIEMGELDDSFFQETVQAREPSNRKAKIKSQRHIKEARDFLTKAVSDRLDPSDPIESLKRLTAFKNTLRSDLIMACITVDSDGNAFQIFETLNDRGLRLSVPDLLLNYLMRVAPDEDRKQIRKVWNEMLTLMGKRDIGRFLRHLWVSRYGDLKNEGLFPALRARIDTRELSSLAFAQGCNAECVNYVPLVTFSAEHLGAASGYVKSLVHDLGAQSALPLLLAAYSKFEKADFDNVVKWLIVFVTRWSVFLGLDPAGLEALLFDMARDVRNCEDEPKAKKTKLGEIKERLSKQSPTDKQILTSVATMILPSESAEYIARRIADLVQTKTKETTISGETNLEHIYPQNPEEAEWGGEAGHAALEPYTWHIGNVVSLGERLNNKAKNAEFDKKREVYDRSELAIAKSIATDYQHWDVAAIEGRAQKLGPFLIDIWSFDNPSRV